MCHFTCNFEHLRIINIKRTVLVDVAGALPGVGHGAGEDAIRGSRSSFVGEQNLEATSRLKAHGLKLTALTHLDVDLAAFEKVAPLEPRPVVFAQPQVVLHLLFNSEHDCTNETTP